MCDGWLVTLLHEQRVLTHHSHKSFVGRISSTKRQEKWEERGTKDIDDIAAKDIDDIIAKDIDEIIASSQQIAAAHNLGIYCLCQQDLLLPSSSSPSSSVFLPSFLQRHTVLAY